MTPIPTLAVLLSLLLGSMGFLEAADTTAAKTAAARPPNFIVVLSDDVGLSRIGCYGGAPFQTPCLDHLAETGLRFERCYSMPVCGPSRAAMLTGNYPFHTGALANDSSIVDPRKHPTITNVLHENGYATCAIGKLGQTAREDDLTAPALLGFDEYMLWTGRKTPDRYWGPHYYRNGQFMQGKPEEDGPDLTQELLVDFMERHRETPFFVYYSAVLAHVPLEPTPDTKPDAGKSLIEDMVSYLDKQMGQLAADLDRLGLRDNTIIIFTSDNGPTGSPLGTIHGQPMIGKKDNVQEGGVREPLIINCPKLVPAGRVSPDLTDFTDILPTLLDLAGIPAPAGLKLDGRSIAPQILGHPGHPRDWVYAQVGREFFIADHHYKLYGNGKFVDIAGSPVAESPVSPADAMGATAREHLAAALAALRAEGP